MTNIVKCTLKNLELLATLAQQTFLDAYGGGADNDEIDTYATKNFNQEILKKELSNPNINYHILYYNNEVAGFSKIVLNAPNNSVIEPNITKLDRLYLLKEFYGQNLGAKLMDFNIELSKNNEQKGLWLYVWTENYRAVNFYKKCGFKIVGSYDFKISETRSNPNHIVYLEY